MYGHSRGRITMISVIDKYKEFQKCHDGQKMEMMEEFLSIALNENDPTDWVKWFLRIA
jgi:hypothetical protein